MLELLIDKKENVKTIMLVENGILVEKHEEHENQKRLEGNIYIGKVQNVLQGMQSAFINIGEDKNTLIKIKDILPKVDEKEEKVDTSDKKITDYLKTGMDIVVQIKKDGTLTKGAKVSTHINLPGRFIALLPNTSFITVSQKIESEEERQRLIQIVKRNLPKNMGAIIRTAGENKNEEEIKQDIEKLIIEWRNIQENLKESKAPKLLYNNQALVRRTILDIIDRGLERIIINDKETYNAIINNLKEFDIKIELRENEDLFKIYNLSDQIKKLSQRKVWLKSGGFITIDKTEALTAIDVNTGKFVGKKNIEQTAYIVNKEATVEIAKQLRLRDIGGIVIIDYIDMYEEKNKQEIEMLLKKELKKDRTKCQVEGFTKLNLLEMTRKNMCNNDWNNETEN